jgi:hypothetical protein
LVVHILAQGVHNLALGVRMLARGVHMLAQGVHMLARGVHMLARGVHMLTRGARTLEWEGDKAQVCDMLELAEDDMAQVRGILVLDEVGHKDLDGEMYEDILGVEAPLFVLVRQVAYPSVV